MRITDRDYASIEEGEFAGRVFVHALPEVTVWKVGGLQILLVDNVRGLVAVCTYDTMQERDMDASIVRRLSENHDGHDDDRGHDDDGPGAGAARAPVPPRRSGPDAVALPADGYEILRLIASRMREGAG